MTRVLLVLALLCAACSAQHAAAQNTVQDAYAAWTQNRPSESLPLLIAAAEAQGSAAAFADAGLCAAAAGERGYAIALLIAAWRLDPQHDTTHQALRALDVVPPAGWLARLGPLAWPGLHWCGALLGVLGGGATGFALVLWCVRPDRLPRLTRLRAGLLVGGLLALGLCLPGVIADLHDRALPIAGVVRDTRLLDSAGNPGAAVPAGSLIEREPQPPWAGRIAVRVQDGRRGFLAEADLRWESPLAPSMRRD